MIYLPYRLCHISAIYSFLRLLYFLQEGAIVYDIPTGGVLYGIDARPPNRGSPLRPRGDYQANRAKGGIPGGHSPPYADVPRSSYYTNYIRPILLTRYSTEWGISCRIYQPASQRRKLKAPQLRDSYQAGRHMRWARRRHLPDISSIADGRAISEKMGDWRK